MTVFYRRLYRGFTLIELMIVIMVMGILAALAYPSFERYITISRRTDAKAMLSRVALYLARNETVTYRFDREPNNTAINDARLLAIGLNKTPDNDPTVSFYRITFAQGPTNNAYVVMATPQGQQAQREVALGCDTPLALDNLGRRGFWPAGATQVVVSAASRACWER